MAGAVLRRTSGPVALLAFCLTLALSSPAQAVIGGQFDGNAHPNVGMIIGCDELCDELGPLFSCTGTLVGRSTVLTNAHCVRDDPDYVPVLYYQVSFEAQTRLNPEPAVFELKNPISGSPDPHPDWTWEGLRAAKGATALYRHQEKDVGLLNLDRPADEVYPGIAPAPLAPAGALQGLKPSKTTVTQVGYGVQAGQPPDHKERFVDGSRNRSEFPLQEITPTLAFNHANPNDSRGYGMPCAGDSGSPWLFNGVVGVVFSFGVPCRHGGGPRIDAGPGRAFLRSRGLVE